MRISNIKVYDLEESIVASGFPKLCKYPTSEEFTVATVSVSKDGRESDHLKRMIKLSSAPDGSGHKNALKGILVAMNIQASNKWWIQAERYSHFNIVSSMSTQHRLRELIDNDEISFARDTSLVAISDFIIYANENPDLSSSELSFSVPAGMELTARVTTNYLQLRTMWMQRKDHKLWEWRNFCDTIATLPYADVFITN